MSFGVDWASEVAVTATVAWFLALPVVLWATTGLALVVAVRRAAPRTLLRLAAVFLGLWSLLATTALAWTLARGGWAAVVMVETDPAAPLAAGSLGLWAIGAAGALGVFAAAFLLNQLVGRGLVGLSRARALPWPDGLPRPDAETSLLQFRSPRAEALTFTLLEFGGAGGWRPHRREVILLSEPLLAPLDPSERRAVIAHELGHLVDLDGRYLTFLRTLSRMMRWDPLMAYLARRVTREEEWRADDTASRLTGDPLSLARALYKVSTPEYAGGPAPAGLVGAGGSRGERDVAVRIWRLLAQAEGSSAPGEIAH